MPVHVAWLKQAPPPSRKMRRSLPFPIFTARPVCAPFPHSVPGTSYQVHSPTVPVSGTFFVGAFVGAFGSPFVGAFGAPFVVASAFFESTGVDDREDPE